MAKKRAGALVADARGELAKGALTAAQTLLQQARTLDPETPEAKRVERDLRLARVEQERLRQRAETAQKALASAKAALERGELEAALTFAREVVELVPDSQEARAIEAEALRKLDEDVAGPAGTGTAVVPVPEVEKTILAPARRTPAPPAPAAPATKRHPKISGLPPAPRAPRKDRFEGVRAFAASAQAAILATPKRQRLIIGGSVAGVLVIAAIVAGVMMIPAAPVPTGTLVIDAVPWATITAVQAEDGTSRPLPNPASTPLSLNLPVGTYRIGIAGPLPGSEPRTMTVQVQEGAVAAMPVERFDT
ncbi:MAG: hypothetical protein ACREI7_08525, partial [Myxococcota bacterium]